MTDRAPERIWLEPKCCIPPLGSYEARSPIGGECRHGTPRTEYVRADLVPPPPALSGEAEEVVRFLKLIASGHSVGLGRDWQVKKINKAASLIERQAREIAEMRWPTLNIGAAIRAAKKGTP